MKPCLKRVSPAPESSINVCTTYGNDLTDQFHYHPELELTLVKNSKGFLKLENDSLPFQADDIFLLGPNMPHQFAHDFVKSNKPMLKQEAVSIHFDESFIGNSFMQLPEVASLKGLFENAKFGIKLIGSLKSSVRKKMEKMQEGDCLERLLLHVEILLLIEKSGEYITLCKQASLQPANRYNEKRISQVYVFTEQNYNREVTIDEVATIAGLTKESFCRFFKNVTSKTYFQYLIEFRIAKACKLLRDNDCSVKEIAYKCGYENLSNFHHQFKKVALISPVQFQNNHFFSTDAALISAGFSQSKNVA